MVESTHVILLYIAVFVIHRLLILRYIGVLKRNEEIDPYSDLRIWIIFIGVGLLLVQFYVVYQYIGVSLIFSGSSGGNIVLGHLLYSLFLLIFFNYANIELELKNDDTTYKQIYSIVRDELFAIALIGVVGWFVMQLMYEPGR
jgi:hypothetical protein